jgi:hypothetical protein
LLLLILAAGGALWWHWARQPKAYWEVVRLEGAPAVGSTRLEGTGRLGVGEWIETDGASRARVKVGAIGSVDVGPNTRLRLVAARAGEHRLALGSGRIAADISAPPRLFFVETRGGTAVDLGCRYELSCDAAGSGLLRVAAGWVALEWGGRESLVPAGAACRTRPRLGPGTPWFEDAPEPLVRGLDTLDPGGTDAAALAVVLAQARVRDTLSLWHLLSRVSPGDRPSVYDRMAELSPPPGDLSRALVLELDPKALNRWKEELAWTW